MEWSQFFGFLLTIAGLFFWNRSESRSDHRELKTSTDAQLLAIREDMKAFRELWAQETRDFHGRLCSIEERNRK